MLKEAHPSTSQPQVVEDESPAGEAIFLLPYRKLQKHLDAGKLFFCLERETACDTVKKNWTDTCADVSGSYLRKETGPSSEVAVDHTVCKIPQGSEKVEASKPPH